MATARLAAIADAIVTELTALSMPAGATAIATPTRRYVRDSTDQDTTFNCFVAAVTSTPSKLTRQLKVVDGEAYIILTKRIDDAENATIDPLVLTVETIMDWFAEPHKLSGLTNFQATGEVSVELVVDPETIDTRREFQSVVTVTIQGQV